MVVLRCLCTFHTLCREVFSVVNLDIWNGKGRRSWFRRYLITGLSNSLSKTGDPALRLRGINISPSFWIQVFFSSTYFVEVSGTFGHVPIGGGKKSEGVAMEIYDSFFYNLPFSEILALVILCFQIPKWDNECCCQVLHCCHFPFYPSRCWNWLFFEGLIHLIKDKYDLIVGALEEPNLLLGDSNETSWEESQMRRMHSTHHVTSGMERLA